MRMQPAEQPRVEMPAASSRDSVPVQRHGQMVSEMDGRFVVEVFEWRGADRRLLGYNLSGEGCVPGRPMTRMEAEEALLRLVWR
jgi:hypothetical protein